MWKSEIACSSEVLVDCFWNVMAHTQKPDFVFRRNGQVHLNQPGGRGVSSVDCWQPRCAPSAVVMLDTSCSEVVWSALTTHCIRQFPLNFLSPASPCAITFQLDSTSLPDYVECYPRRRYIHHHLSLAPDIKIHLFRLFFRCIVYVNVLSHLKYICTVWYLTYKRNICICLTFRHRASYI